MNPGQSHCTVVVGLPGSGKSSLIAELKVANPDLVDADDFHSCSQDNLPQPEASRYAVEITAGLVEGRDIVISDIAFCDGARRLALDLWLSGFDLDPELVEWVFFANDLDQCLRNVEGHAGRDAESDARAARAFARAYFPPADARAVYRPAESPSNE